MYQQGIAKTNEVFLILILKPPSLFHKKKLCQSQSQQLTRAQAAHGCLPNLSPGIKKYTSKNS